MVVIIKISINFALRTSSTIKVITITIIVLIIIKFNSAIIKYISIITKNKFGSTISDFYTIIFIINLIVTVI